MLHKYYQLGVQFRHLPSVNYQYGDYNHDSYNKANLLMEHVMLLKKSKEKDKNVINSNIFLKKRF